MTRTKNSARAPLFLGLEGGGTRTVALMADAKGKLLRRLEFGPANLKLLDGVELERHFRSVAKAFAWPSALGVGLAGVRGEEDRRRVLEAAAKIWPKVPCGISHDLETALLAAEGSTDFPRRTRVIVLSGTGSCCYGRTPEGKTAKVGGWGHLLGDKGSGYEIGLRALKATVYYFDRDGVWSTLGQSILRAVQLNEPNDLVGWAQSADKKEIAALALEVFAAWGKGEKIATDIVTGAAHSLANDAAACAKRLVRSEAEVEFVFTGSVLLKAPRFSQMVARQLGQLWPKAVIKPLAVESAWGAVELAKRQLAFPGAAWDEAEKRQHESQNKAVESFHSVEKAHSPASGSVSPESTRISPTEERNPRSVKLDKLPLLKAIELMLEEEAQVTSVLRTQQRKIARAIQFIVQAFRRGGRLFYLGAGTSGRLGVLDASECPPTFRVSPEQVQGIIAGGQLALWSSIEGAEDDALAGARAIEFRGIRQEDVVVGIAASGRTPFVWGALGEAKKRGAKTMLLCFNPYLKISKSRRPDLVLAPNLGPEVLTGSTRLKAGTATKLVLNLLTTLSMVRLGKVASNLMVDLNPSNTKLRDRAVRIVRDLTGADDLTAEQALERSSWVVKTAWQLLARKRGHIRKPKH